MAPRVKQALAGVAAESEAKGERGKVPMTGGSEPEEDPALRGIPKALLEKVSHFRITTSNKKYLGMDVAKNHPNKLRLTAFMDCHLFYISPPTKE